MKTPKDEGRKFKRHGSPKGGVATVFVGKIGANLDLRPCGIPGPPSINKRFLDAQWHESHQLSLAYLSGFYQNLPELYKEVNTSWKRNEGIILRGTARYMSDLILCITLNIYKHKYKV